MCGFVGFMNLDRPVDVPQLLRMTNSIDHRGPDDEGVALFSLSNRKYREIRREVDQNGTFDGFEGGVGFKRLSIIDTSSAGHQPMVSEDRKVVIVFNGEIYNSKEIAEKLKRSGQPFNGHSDTEVLLRLYIQEGLTGLLQAIDGMYAIALLDLNLQRLSLIRDHVGIKPLYYYKDSSAAIFGSEVKAFLPHRSFRRGLNEKKVSEFILFRYISDNQTLFDGVEQVPPGCVVNIGPDGGINCTKYYSLPSWGGTVRRGAGREDDLLPSLIHNSVSAQLVSDVPIGCQLSGGIDSSLICAAASGNGQLSSFSVIFRDPVYSEEKHIDHVSDALGLERHKFCISEEYFVDNLVRAAWHLDEPIHHPNSLGILYLSECASNYVKVLLSGEGADELFGGYSRFLYANLPFNPILRELRCINTVAELPLIRKLGIHRDDAENFISMSTAGDELRTRAVFPGLDFERALGERLEIFHRSDGPDSFLGRCLDYEMNTYLPSVLLRQDKMTMANSMENRVPFLGRDFMAQSRAALTPQDCVSLPHGLPSRRNVMRGTKIPLKRLAGHQFGANFAFRPKQGFGFPIASLLNNNTLLERFHDDWLPKLKYCSPLEEGSIVKSWDCRREAPEQAFTILSLGLWASLFL